MPALTDKLLKYLLRREVWGSCDLGTRILRTSEMLCSLVAYVSTIVPQKLFYNKDGGQQEQGGTLVTV